MISDNLTSNSVLPPANEIAASPGTTGLASDFDTFLKMLTAQAKYQDPLEPLDSTQFASQLAQFSMVEQQVVTNSTLATMISQMGVNDITSLASWVGMEVRAAAPIQFDGTPITLSPNPASVADRVELVAINEQGAEVQRQSIPVSADPIEWTGLDDDGIPFPPGTYQFRVDSYQGSEVILSETAEVYSKVTEAQVFNGEIVLILEGGQAVRSSSVSSIRAPI